MCFAGICGSLTPTTLAAIVAELKFGKPDGYMPRHGLQLLHDAGMALEANVGPEQAKELIEAAAAVY